MSRDDASPGDAQDARWVKAARAGSEPAFARLVSRHQRAVRSFLMRVAANPADADDLAQETFLAAWSALAQLRTPGHFKSWLMGMAWRKAKSQARSAARTSRRDHDWQSTRAETHTPQPEAVISMRRALMELPDDQRAALALCAGEGWTHADAARILGLPVGTVKSHITRGRARVLAHLDTHVQPETGARTSQRTEASRPEEVASDD
ncbi:RNA polymerase sigma factor [Maricaulis sp. D1M11]|uniref:RNA polymerase sigma factor n=1 Tax=Maricaulis sp. D1M11 TaxID=3076117 RepID=UPI0039B6A0B3